MTYFYLPHRFVQTGKDAVNKPIEGTALDTGLGLYQKRINHANQLDGLADDQVAERDNIWGSVSAQFSCDVEA